MLRIERTNAVGVTLSKRNST